ncbi:MAG: SGNH/GDSL hydrolase family protein [Saprospiraceae bacterium]|nr:SGNH/GDSL hydrolase family protein [Saprospiraceae bacterium]
MKRGILLSVGLMIIAQLSAQVINAGVSGNTTADLLRRLGEDVLVHKPDLVILMVGTNDMLNSKKLISYQDYQENMEEIVRRIKERGTEVLIMSSPPVDSAYLFQRHDRSLYAATPNEKMKRACGIVDSVATEYGLYFLDLYEKLSELGLPKHNEDLFIKNLKNSGRADGVHPTPLGYYFIATHIYQLLKENNLTDKNIVCFGDSITFGGERKGGDELIRRSYPAFLEQLLKQSNR